MPSNDRPTKLTESLFSSTGAYELVLSALIVGVLGYGLDRWLGTAPVFVIVMSILGFLGASASLYSRYKLQLARDITK